MKKTINIFLFTLAGWSFLLTGNVSFAQSQTAYTVLFQNPAEEMPVDIVEDSIGLFYAVGFAGYLSNPWEFKGLAYRIASATDTMSRRISFNDTVTRFFKIIPRKDQTFTIIGTISNPPDYTERLMIAFMDKDLAILSRKEYILKNYTRIDQMEYILGRDNSIWLYGSLGIRPDPAIDFFLCKLNYNGDTIKTGYYLPHHPLGYSALFSPDSTRLWIFGKSFDLNAIGQRAIFDTNFTFISSTRIPNDIHTNLNVKWFNDNQILLGGMEVFHNPIQDDDIRISFMDTSLTCSNIHYFGAPDTIDDPGGERFIDYITKSKIFYTGTHNLQFNFYPTGVSWIMTGLIDSSLNTIYQQFYGGDAYYLSGPMVATKDGGCMIVGKRYDHNVQNFEMDVIFLKFDSTGSITGISAQGEDPAYSIIIYPNPGGDLMRLKCNMEDLIFQLYDQKGILLQTVRLEKGENYIPTANLKRGSCYVYRILNRQKTVITGKWIKN